MAQYGYSTPYSGQQVAPLPPGYMEAATAPGRNLAMGITAIGQGLGKALERYTENKKAHEAADQTNTAVTQMFLQQMENDPKVKAVRYFEDTGQLPTGVDETTLKSYEAQMKRDAGMISNLVGSSAKWADMSLTKKKTALGDTVTMLNQYRTNQQDDLKNEATRQALQLGKYQLEDILSKRKQNEILSGAVQFGMDQPTTTTQTEQVTSEVPGAPMPPMPGQNVPATQVPPTFNEQGYIEALRRYRETTTPEVNIADIKAQLAQLAPQLSETPGTIQIPSLGGGLGGGMAVGRATISETPQQIAGRIAQVLPKVRQLESQLQSAQKQPLEMPRREQFLTQVEAQPSAMPAPLSAPLTVTRNVSTQVPISYEDQSKRLTQYLLQQGAKPETLAMVPQILSMVGQRMPTRVEQVGNLGSIVSFGGNPGQFVPAPKADIGDMLKVKGLTIDFPEFRGTAPTESEAKDFREQYDTNLKLRGQIVDLLKLTSLGKTQLQTPENKAKAQGLSRSIQATMRKDILGAGVVTEPDQKILNAIIPDPTVLFSWPSANKAALEGLLSRATSNLNTKAKSIGLDSVSLNQSKQPQSSSGRFTIVPGKGIQPIQ